MRVAQAHDLALDRAQRDRGQAADRAAPRARRRRRRARRRRRPRRRADAGDPGALALDPLDGRPRTQSQPLRGGPPQRGRSTVARGSAAWSPGTASASRIVGASAGSSLRAALGSESLHVRGRARGAARARARAPRPRRGRVRRRARRSRRPGSMPDACASSAANAGQAPALRSPSSSSASSPGSASVTGASIPAATCEAPPPSSPRSSTRTPCPRCAARHATASPITPPPMTTTSEVAVGSCGIAPRFAGMIRISC